MKDYALALILGLVGCTPNKSHQTDKVPSTFEEKYQAYSALAAPFPETSCDWLLFESILEASRRSSGSVERAEGEPGRWYRTPAHDCLATGRSKSDISRDMLLGLALYLWQKEDPANVKEVMDYSETHAGVMGEGDGERTLMTPVLYNTYKSILARSGSFPLPPKIEDPDINQGLGLSLVTGFEAHLLVLHIYLRGLVYGELSGLETTILADQAQRQPRNALFQAVYHKFLDGKQDAALAVLMDESLFPAAKLPTNDNYCEPYLWQRDTGEDWLPCVGESLHTGADWLVAATVIRNGFRESHE